MCKVSKHLSKRSCKIQALDCQGLVPTGVRRPAEYQSNCFQNACKTRHQFEANAIGWKKTIVSERLVRCQPEQSVCVVSICFVRWSNHSSTLTRIPAWRKLAPTRMYCPGRADEQGGSAHRRHRVRKWLPCRSWKESLVRQPWHRARPYLSQRTVGIGAQIFAEPGKIQRS